MLSSIARRTAMSSRLQLRAPTAPRTFSSSGSGGGSSSAAAAGKGVAAALVCGSAVATVVYLYAANSATSPSALLVDVTPIDENRMIIINDDAKPTTSTSWFDEVKDKVLEGSTSSCAAAAVAAPPSKSSSSSSPSSPPASASASASPSSDPKAKQTSTTTEEEKTHLETLTTVKDSNTGRLYKPVKVDLDPKIVEELPVMSIAEVRAADGLGGDGQRLLASYEGIVYDVTEFANHHPGGRDLLRTAAGLDLKHFFVNYTVHGMSDKAANWLAPLAIGKLSLDDAETIAKETTPEVHVEKRHVVLGRSRRKLLLVTLTLPIWMALRAFIRMIGAIVPCVGRMMAAFMPVSVPGYSKGAERLNPRSELDEFESVQDKNGNWIRQRKDNNNNNNNNNNKPYSVAVIGGGVAGCGAAWALNRSGFKVTLFESRPQISGNARTFDWDFTPFKDSGKDVVKSCVSVTAWPPIYYKNYTALLAELAIETVPMPLSWFLNSKVPGYEGTLWGADPRMHAGSLRKVFEKDFKAYAAAERFARITTDLFCLNCATL